MGKVVLVTGASSGIGEATARLLAEQGWTVYAAARRTDRLAALADAGIRPLSMDVTDDASMSAGVDQVIAESGRIDALVNNAGYGSYGALEDVPLSEARAQFDVNVFGLARLTQLVLPHLRAQRSGRIVNISSIGGKIYEPLGSWYHATKFAVEGLSDSLRLELKPFGIDVVIVEPGSIATEWSGISADNLRKTSGEGAYAEQVEPLAALLSTDTSLSSPPSAVAAGIAKALNARRPRTRYAVAGGAKPIVAMRRLLPDRALDAVLLRVIASAGRRAERAAERTPA